MFNATSRAKWGEINSAAIEYFYALVAFLSCASAAQPHKGLFTNYVYKRKGVGSPKLSIFVNIHKVENLNGGG